MATGRHLGFLKILFYQLITYKLLSYIYSTDWIHNLRRLRCKCRQSIISKVFWEIQYGRRQPSWIWPQNSNLIAEMKSGGQKPSKNIFHVSLYDKRLLIVIHLTFSKWPSAAILDFWKYYFLYLKISTLFSYIYSTD